jgi:hypothetical protein
MLQIVASLTDDPRGIIYMFLYIIYFYNTEHWPVATRHLESIVF